MRTDTLEAATITLGTAETAERLGVSPGTLANWRTQGKGPRYVRVGGRVRYRLLDLVDFLEESTRRSTSDPVRRPCAKVAELAV